MTPIELERYLTRLIETQLALSVMIWGPPGVGKSSIVRRVAQAQGLKFIDLRLSQLAPTDLRGLPVPRDGIAYWAPPDFLPHHGQGVLFLDEINMAPPAMQGVAQQLILDRQIGSYQLPDGWYVWSAGNRKEDRASVYDMPSPLANRFIHLEVAASIDDFRRHAVAHGFHEAVLGFVAFRPELLHQLVPNARAWPSPRSWEMAGRLHDADLDVAPAVGEAAATEFYAYLDVLTRLPDIDGILSGKQQPDFPTEVSLRYATVMGMISRIATDSQALAGLRWLIAGAHAEWVQLYAADLFPKLRELNVLAPVQAQILKEPKLRDFLTQFARLLAA